jgi:Carboxypeptidase regulatory-like domain
MLPRRWLVFAAFLALGVPPGQAQTRGTSRAVFSIDGVIRDDSSHAAMESIRVDLTESGGVPLTSTFTRANGEFVFDGLPNGEYTIQVNVTGYEPARQAVSVFGAAHHGLTIFLTRSTKVQNLRVEATISAHQLSVPRKAHDEFEKGMLLIYSKSDYRGAIDQFQRAIKDFPTYYEAYAEEGGAYYQLQELGAAEEALKKSVDLSSGQYADALFTLAALLTDTKHYTDAADAARRGMTVDTSSWRGPFELARAQAALKQPEDAEKNAMRSRDLMPDNAPVYLLLANIHIQRKDYPSLLRDLDDYLRLAPTSQEADRARKTREEVKARLSNPPGIESESNEQGDPKQSAKQSHPVPKVSPPPLEPDDSGLPSLPPPTRDNQ